jgi:hypothetical protein
MATSPPQTKFIDGTSTGATFTSDQVNLVDAGACSIELHSDAAARAGAITIEVSNSGDNWTAIGWINPSTGAWSTSDTVTTGVAYDMFLDLSSIGARFLRVVYTKSAGTVGTMDGYLFGKNWSMG